MTTYAPAVPTRACECLDFDWPWACADCGMEYVTEERAIECCGAGADPIPCFDCHGTGAVLALRMGDVLCSLCHGRGVLLFPVLKGSRETHPETRSECVPCRGRGLIQEAE